MADTHMEGGGGKLPARFVLTYIERKDDWDHDLWVPRYPLEHIAWGKNLLGMMVWRPRVIG